MALETAGFTLSVRPLSALLPHEETIPTRVKQLALEIKRDGVQKDPMIIDRESGTVLDGMHRLAAFDELELKNAVCCAVDYSSRAVTLSRWARVYTINAGDSLERALGESANLSRSTLAEGFAALERRDAGIAVLTSSAAYLSRGKSGLGEALANMSAFDRLSEERKWERQFVPEDDIDVPLQVSGKFVVLVMRLAKDDVVTAARTGNLFPCKTSMHRIDPRPVAVDFPIGELNEATTAKLRSKLRGKEGHLTAPGSVYGGRMYKERLLLLNQD